MNPNQSRFQPRSYLFSRKEYLTGKSGMVRQVYIYVAVCLLVLLASFLRLSAIFENYSISFVEFIRLIYPQPDPNGFYGTSYIIYTYIYALLVAMVILVCLASIFLKKKEGYKEEISLRKYFERLFIVYFLVICCIQLIIHIFYFKQIFSFNTFTSDYIEKEMLFGKPFDFAAQCQSKLPFSCKAKLITDLDLNNADNMTVHRRLAYFLYPINIRAHNQSQEPECLVFYKKANAKEFIPDGYHLVYQMDPEHLVVIKDDFTVNHINN